MSDGARDVYLSVVMPIYNIEAAIADNLRDVSSYLGTLSFASELILIDDGSRDSTHARAREAAAELKCVSVMGGGRNRGKGACVAEAFGIARGSYMIFIDADLAYPPEEIGKILRQLEMGADVAIACRVLPESRFVMSPSFFHYLYTRHAMGRLFNLIVRATMVPGILDTQAGLKGFRRTAAAEIFSRQTISRFSFDVENLYVARKLGLRIAQVGVNFGYFYEASSVRFLGDTMNMMLDLAKIRLNDLRGVYDKPLVRVQQLGVGRESKLAAVDSIEDVPKV
jgi:dolichyl-phosphate beta-glucosyltransferase